MFVFLEGVPRSGKSYECLKFHILPSLAAGRHVWARMNGLEKPQKRQAIADYLKLPISRVDELLHHVETNEVLDTFKCYRDEQTGRWRIADHFKNALIVIDEVHEFYVASRAPLPPEVENFYALLGQNGGDGIIMTQMFSRLHRAMVARIEKKNSIQKLSAVGMDASYLVTYFQTVSAGKFEKIGSEKKKYDPDIYPLYDGYADGVTNTAVYKQGGTNVWRSMAPKAAIALVAVALAAWGLGSFFLGGGEGLMAEGKAGAPVITEPVDSYDLDGNYLGSQGGKPGPVVPKVVDPYSDLTPEQRYIAELSDKGRARLAARAVIGGRTVAQVEWVDTSGLTLESLWLTDLEALGYVVTTASYGVRMAAGKTVLIATAWPRVMPVRDLDARLYDTSQAGGAAGLVSVANEHGGAAAIPGSVIVGFEDKLGGGPVTIGN